MILDTRLARAFLFDRLRRSGHAGLSASRQIERLFGRGGGTSRRSSSERCSPPWPWTDPDLAAEVERFLAADARAGRFLEDAVAAGAAAMLQDGAQDEIGRRLGPYRLVRELGRGGMGVVYLAERDDQEFQQRVAIKLLHRGLETAEILARFQTERQILARLSIPPSPGSSTAARPATAAPTSSWS